MAVQYMNSDTASVEQGVKCLIYGESGNGKTFLARSLPKETTLVVSVESGVLSLQGAGMHVLKCETFEDVVSVLNAMDTTYAFAQNVLVDSGSEIAEKVLAYHKPKTKEPRQAYNSMAEHTIMLIKLFRDLPRRNVFITAKAETDKDGVTGLMVTTPSMPGRVLTKELPYLFDEVFYLGVSEVDDGAGKKIRQRYLQTDRDLTKTAKDRSGKLDFFEPADLSHILNKITTGA